MIVIAAMATLIVVTLDWESPIRVAVTLCFLVFGPGLALAELLEITDPVQRLALAPAASLAVETLVATALLYAGVFSAQAAVTIVVGMSCVAVAGAVLRRGWHMQRRPPTFELPSTTA